MYSKFHVIQLFSNPKGKIMPSSAIRSHYLEIQIQIQTEKQRLLNCPFVGPTTFISVWLPSLEFVSCVSWYCFPLSWPVCACCFALRLLPRALARLCRPSRSNKSTILLLFVCADSKNFSSALCCVLI